MENGMVKKICLIAAMTLFAFVMILMLCGVAFMAGSINNRPIVQPEYGYAPTLPQSEQPARNPLSQLERDTLAATALLYRKDKSGFLDFRCTATAFEREKDYYHFVTAAHCVAEDDVANRLVKIKSGKWFLNFHTSEQNEFYPARILAVGYQEKGDDLAVLEARPDRYTPIIRLADEDPKVGETVSSFAGPLNLGKRLFRGYVSREPIPGDENILLEVHCGGGSSGSAIVSHEKKAIVAIVWARLGGWFVFEPMADTSFAIPISKFHKFWAAVQARNYEYFDWRSFESEQPEIKDSADDEMDAGENEDADDDIGGVED